MSRNLNAAYRAEPWFDLLQAACKREPQRFVAQRLGVSDGVISQVLHGTGAYGSGRASTDKVAARVVHKFGVYECPHLTEQYGERRVISAMECRSYAHRAAPAHSPRDLAHWRACNTCEHKPLSAPAPVRVPKPRKKPALAAPDNPVPKPPAAGDAAHPATMAQEANAS